MDAMTSHTLDDAAPWQHLEPRDLVQPPDDLGGEVTHSGRIEQLGTNVGFIADQVLEPWSATQDGRLKWFCSPASPTMAQAASRSSSTPPRPLQRGARSLQR